MAYTTVTAWQAYATVRGDTAPASARAGAAAAALARADDYIRLFYVSKFMPGLGADGATRQAALTEAVHIAASLELAHPGFFTSTFTPADQKRLTKLGAMQWDQVQTSDTLTANEMAQPRSTAIEAVLRPYLPPLNGGVSAQLV